MTDRMDVRTDTTEEVFAVNFGRIADTTERRVHCVEWAAPKGVSHCVRPDYDMEEYGW